MNQTVVVLALPLLLLGTDVFAAVRLFPFSAETQKKMAKCSLAACENDDSCNPMKGLLFTPKPAAQCR